MQFIDAVAVGATRRTADGYLAADVRTARTGVQVYKGDEVGRPDLEWAIVYRPEEQVFDRGSMASFANKPVTNDHPSEMVTADNHRDLSVGHVGEEVARDGEYVRVPLMVTDARTIDLIEKGKKGLSAGYVCDLLWTPGTIKEGEHTITYDAIQTNIRINHIAIVDHGRAGAECRIGDAPSTWGAFPVNQPISSIIDRRKDVPDIKTRTVVVDGISIETTDQGAQMIERLQGQLRDSAANVESLKATHKDAIAAKDKELGEKDAKIEALEKAKVSDADLDQMVADRSAIVDAAKHLVEKFDATGKSNADIRREVVSDQCGADAVKDKSDEYIEARFDALVTTIDTDTIARGMKDGAGKPAPKQSIADEDKAHQAMLDSQSKAWRDDEEQE